MNADNLKVIFHVIKASFLSIDRKVQDVKYSNISIEYQTNRINRLKEREKELSKLIRDKSAQFNKVCM